MTRRRSLAALPLVAVFCLGAPCGGGPPGTPPTITLTLYGIEDSLNDLLVVPEDALLFVNVSYSAGAAPVEPSSLSVAVYPWSGDPPAQTFLWRAWSTGALAFVPPGALASGTWKVVAWVHDVEGRAGAGQLDLAVRPRPGAPPIGTTQQVWYDFTSDRDGIPGPDFAFDLEFFGLGSPADPILSGQVEADVVERVLGRVEQAYYDEDPIGLTIPDPVSVGFHATDPGTGDVTRICVGGEDPSGGTTIGSILIDPGNANRTSQECGTIPPTGIFPREMLVYANQYPFQTVFDPLMASRGGTPVGAHLLDPIVLDPAFDPVTASAGELARWTDVTTAVQNFGDALGSIVAHETGHALGLVAPGMPGVGLHGGQSGLVFAHDVEADGTTSPSPNFLMKHGGTFNWARLAGTNGHPLPFLRPLDHAWLRDRVMTDPRVTQLLPPPDVGSVTPSQLLGSALLTVTGQGFSATPALRLTNASYTYSLLGEAWLSGTTVTGWVSYPQVPPGLYDLVLENPDGQLAQAAAAVQIGP